MMFLKINKKILIIIAAILVVVLIAGFFVYKYSKEIKTAAENSKNGAIMETQEEQIITPGVILPEQGQKQPPLDLGNPQIEIQPQPGLTICADRCGDGVCQASDPECKDDMNCTCAETKADCPQDCK